MRLEISSKFLLLSSALIVLFAFSCKKETDKPLFLQENLAEHNQLIDYEKIFPGDSRLNFNMVVPTNDGNLYYLAQNTAEDIEYFTIVVGGGGIPSAPLPSNNTSFEVGKMTLQGNKIWARSFAFSPRKLFLPTTSEDEIMFVIGGKLSKGHISILSASGSTISEYEYQSQFDNFFFQDIASIPNTNRFLLAGNAYTTQNSQVFVPHLIELEFNEGTYDFEIVLEKTLFAYQAWPVNISATSGLPSDGYILSLQHFPGYGSSVFLDTTFTIKKNLSQRPARVYFSTTKERHLQIVDDKIYIIGDFLDTLKPSSPGNYFQSILVHCLSFSGDVLWTSSIALTEYGEVPRTIVPHGEYLYILGSHSSHRDAKGEEEAHFSNALVCKINMADGKFMKAFTFSKNTTPWDANVFDVGFIKNDVFYIFGSTNEQQSNANERARDGWFVRLRMEDLQ